VADLSAEGILNYIEQCTPTLSRPEVWKPRHTAGASDSKHGLRT
jgi:hypothetical protein